MSLSTKQQDLYKLKLSLEEYIMYTNVNVANSEFVGFTMARLDKRYDILTQTIEDRNALDIEIEVAARKRREVRACIEVFIEFEIEDESATVADILEIVTGQSIERLQKQTGGGLLAQDIMEKTGHVAKISTEATKKGLNSFASWLSNKTK